MTITSMHTGLCSAVMSETHLGAAQHVRGEERRAREEKRAEEVEGEGGDRREGGKGKGGEGRK